MNRYALDRVVLGLSEKDLGFGGRKVRTSQAQLAGLPPAIAVKQAQARTGSAKVSGIARYFQAKRNTSARLVDQGQGFARVKGGNEIGSAIIVQVLSEQGPAVSLKKNTAFTLHQGPEPSFPVSQQKKASSSVQAAGFGLHGKKVLIRRQVVPAVPVEIGNGHSKEG